MFNSLHQDKIAILIININIIISKSFSDSIITKLEWHPSICDEIGSIIRAITYNQIEGI